MFAVRILAIYLVVGVISLTAFRTADLLADEKQAQKQKPLFTLSKQTTYVSGPLRKDGTVDYVAALEAIARRGVTVENNAAVLLYQIVGPSEILPELRAEYFKRLGIAPLPIQGGYFVTLDQLVQRAVVGENVSEKEFAKLVAKNLGMRMMNHKVKLMRKKAVRIKQTKWMKIMAAKKKTNLNISKIYATLLTYDRRV